MPSLQWCHNEHNGVSNHQPHDYLLNRLFRRRSKKTSKLRITGLCAGNSPVTGDFPAQRASNAENVSIWWHHLYIVSQASQWRYVVTVEVQTLAHLPRGQNVRRFTDDIFKHIFLNENIRIWIEISLKFVPNIPIANKPALVHVMAWHQTLHEPNLTQFTEAYTRR